MVCSALSLLSLAHMGKVRLFQCYNQFVGEMILFYVHICVYICIKKKKQPLYVVNRETVFCTFSLFVFICMSLL